MLGYIFRHGDSLLQMFYKKKIAFGAHWYQTLQSITEEEHKMPELESLLTQMSVDFLQAMQQSVQEAGLTPAQTMELIGYSLDPSALNLPQGAAPFNLMGEDFDEDDDDDDDGLDEDEIDDENDNEDDDDEE